MAVVVILTVPAAWAVSLFRTRFVPFVYDKPYTAWAIRVLRKVAVVAGVILGIAIVYYSVTSHITSSREKAAVEDYKNEYITMTEIDGVNMAAYITGEGERTILLLGDATDPAPSLTLSPIFSGVESVTVQRRAFRPRMWRMNSSNLSKSRTAGSR